MKRKTVTVTAAAIKAMARQNTKASARLEGRQVPADFVRSPAVERYTMPWRVPRKIVSSLANAGETAMTNWRRSSAADFGAET